MSKPTGAARRRGPFKVGDQVQLTDPKGRHYTFTLEAGKNFHTHKGSFPHDELIGAPEGSVVRTTGNVAYLALRHTLLGGYVLRSRDRAGAEQELWALLAVYQALRMAMTAAIRKVFATNPKEFDPRKYLGPARTAVKDLVRHKVRDVLCCAGHAFD